jgi:hypothetical protein
VTAETASIRERRGAGIFQNESGRFSFGRRHLPSLGKLPLLRIEVLIG